MSKKPKAPEGYEIAPPEHVMRNGVDLLCAYARQKERNGLGNLPPHGFEWVCAMSGIKASAALDDSDFKACYRPIANFAPSKCPHKRVKVLQIFGPKWCRNCGALYYGGKWHKMEGA
jgi:hypothetical protein